MAGNIGKPEVKVGGTARVGAPADPLTALRWKANSHPAVEAVDKQIQALREKQAKAVETFHAERLALDAQRDAAVKVAMRELVG